jgi:hypothetical protein
MAVVAGGARADHDLDTTPSVMECKAQLEEEDSDYHWIAPGVHGADWLCLALWQSIWSDEGRDYFTPVHPSWTVEWEEVAP